MDDTTRDDAIRKVRKLLAWKTQGGVADEQEVMTAIALARKLIARHAITEDELLRANEAARAAARGGRAPRD